ncbi:MAG: DUF1028 domain-containing protein [Solirubrobacteraceae bacterium]
MTYSIVARDQRTGELGVAVQSHFFGAGKVVTWARGGVGAIATQAFANPAFGPDGLDLLSAGTNAADALAGLIAADPGAELRQLAMIDAAGSTAVYTGAACYPVAEHEQAREVSAQGNMLRNAGTVPAMVAAFTTASGELAERLLVALEAAEEAGGDARGRQAAALLVVDGKRTEPADGPAPVDLRVEDSDDPLAELRRLLTLNRGYQALGSLFATDVLGGVGDCSRESVEDALESIERSLPWLPGSAEPLMWRAIVMARGNRPQQAREAAAHALQQAPGLGVFLTRLQDAGVVPADTWAEGSLRR